MMGTLEIIPNKEILNDCFIAKNESMILVFSIFKELFGKDLIREMPVEFKHKYLAN